MGCLIAGILILSLLIVIHLSKGRASKRRPTECIKRPVEDLHLTPDLLADLPESDEHWSEDASEDLADALQKVRWLR